jgi:hypothetical protein
MASKLFNFIYQLGPMNEVMGATFPPATVTTDGDATLVAGETFTTIPMLPIPGANFTFASGDGFVASDMGGGQKLWFTNTAQAPGTTAANGGSSFVVCFLAGTRIATPAGETVVESLAIGDLVLTADGRAAPVRWVGVQVVVSFFADALRSFPIRIAAGALGEGLPTRDLFVSPDHALMLDGVLVHAGALANGTTIVRETEMAERFTYYHVELEDHSLILAEGVPAETFVDNVTRRRFDNFAAYEALYGDTGATIEEMNVPRVKSARQLPLALRARLAARAGEPDGARDFAA